MTAVFVPLSTQPVYYNGKPTVGCKINFYDAGTLTPRTVYGDGLAAAELAQPVLTDANGCIPCCWVVGNPYRVRILSPGGIQVRDVDNLPGEGGSSVSPPPPPPGTTGVSTGDLIWCYGTSIIPGRVRANGKTLGPTGSGATEFEGPTAEALFKFLWNQDHTLVMVGGRGVDANADWNAGNKAITLPDARCRVIAGIDGMGNIATGILSGATWTKGNAAQLGSTGGRSFVNLTVAQLPVHTHTGTTNNNTAIQLTFTTVAAGSHSHTGQTSSESADHYHTGTTGLQNQGHTHSGTTDYQGSHNHGGTQGQSADHTHTYQGAVAGGTAGPGNVVAVATYTNMTTSGVSNTHTHGIGFDGTHQHNIPLGYLGAESANHAHAFTTGGRSTAHVHFITADGSHTHTGTTDLGGVHTHTFTTDPTGSGANIENTQPMIMATLYIVL